MRSEQVALVTMPPLRHLVTKEPSSTSHDKGKPRWPTPGVLLARLGKVAAGDLAAALQQVAHHGALWPSLSQSSSDQPKAWMAGAMKMAGSATVR